MKYSDPELYKWGTLRETCLSIVKSIFKVSGNNKREADRIWERPTETEFYMVRDIAFVIENEKEDPECELCWGEAKIFADTKY